MKDLNLSELPSQTGKTILITGGTSGLGRELVKYLAALGPAKIFFTGRNQARADEVLADLDRRYPLEDGCKNSMWGAIAPREAIQNGAYYSPIAEPGKQTKWTQDEDLGNRLW
ncbi:hypothetical protein KCU93_g5179, partial [Aureobasidium melanogenum]